MDENNAAMAMPPQAQQQQKTQMQQPKANNVGKENYDKNTGRYVQNNDAKAAGLFGFDSPELDETDKTIVNDAIYWAQKKKQSPNITDVMYQLDDDMNGFISDINKNQVMEYIKKYLSSKR